MFHLLAVRIPRALLVLACLVNLLLSAKAYIRHTTGEDQISRQDRILREVRETLRSKNLTIVGYITDRRLSEWSPEDVGNFYQTQYSVAPIVVSQNPGIDRFVIGRFQRTNADDPRFRSLALIRDFGGGIVLYERRSD
jgi:hypothetical protein